MAAYTFRNKHVYTPIENDLEQDKDHIQKLLQHVYGESHRIALQAMLVQIDCLMTARPHPLPDDEIPF
jgi:hypothetical protein